MSQKRIPVNIVAGPLGVGKTTTINHLLTQRPENEHWAILVNEYGLVGLDAALMEKDPLVKDSPGVEIKEVAGGCICCSAGFMFEVSLVVMLQRRPDRLIIEPTGLAALSGILDTLDKPGIQESVDLRSVVCLLDPAKYSESILREEVQDQVEAADVLLASRSDLATTDQLDEFNTWADSIFPAKKCVDQIEHGRIPLEYLDLVVGREIATTRAGHQHGTDHHAHDHNSESTQMEELQCDAAHPMVKQIHRSSTASTIGWVCWEELVFDYERVSCWLSEIALQLQALRTKAVFRTNEGWFSFNFVEDLKEVRPSGYRRDSRLEFIIDGEEYPEPDELEDALRDCIVSGLEIKEFSMRPQDLTVHLHWSGLAEMDLFALCETETGDFSLVSFSAIGEDVAAVELLSDYTFQEIPTDNQEIIQVKKDAGLHWKRIWFWTWDFEQVESNLSKGFSSLNLYLEIKGSDVSLQGDPVENDTGNTVLLGCLDLGMYWTMSPHSLHATAPLTDNLDDMVAFWRTKLQENVT